MLEGDTEVTGLLLPRRLLTVVVLGAAEPQEGMGLEPLDELLLLVV